MELIKIRFGSDLEAIEAAVEKNLSDVFRAASPLFRCSDCLWVPPMDMIETPAEIVVVAEISGVEKEDLEVEITRRAVKISGRRRACATGGTATYRLAEIHYGSFERILYLPVPIDPDTIEAAYSRGMLRVRLAKRPPENLRQIPISDS